MRGKLILKQNVKIAIFQMSLFKCSECNYTSKYKRNFIRHIKIHGPNYKCTECPYTSKYRHNFVRHELLLGHGKMIVFVISWWSFYRLCTWGFLTNYLQIFPHSLYFLHIALHIYALWQIILILGKKKKKDTGIKGKEMAVYSMLLERNLKKTLRQFMKLKIYLCHT